MWVFRSHKVGTPYKACYKRVRQRYLAEVDRGILPTHLEMEEWIDRKMKERTVEATFSIEVCPEVAEACMVEGSLEACYDDITRGSEARCVGVRTRKRTKCVICRGSKHSKIKVSCGCIFHRKCIDEWLRWSAGKTCPVCQAALDYVT